MGLIQFHRVVFLAFLECFKFWFFGSFQNWSKTTNCLISVMKIGYRGGGCNLKLHVTLLKSFSNALSLAANEKCESLHGSSWYQFSWSCRWTGVFGLGWFFFFVISSSLADLWSKSWHFAVQVLDPNMDLRTVKHFIWKSGGDLTLHYRQKSTWGQRGPRVVITYFDLAVLVPRVVLEQPTEPLR